MSQVCVDANLLVEIVLPQDYSQEAMTKWREWHEAGVELIAPSLLAYESISAIRYNLIRKQITIEEADIAVRDMLTYIDGVQLTTPDSLLERAWEISKRLGQGQVYDAYYVALADANNCELWTADEKLYIAAYRVYPKVKHIRSARRKSA